MKVYVFVLGDEHPALNLDSYWLYHMNVKAEVYTVRLKLEEFAVLDIGVHPKVLIVNEGKELAEYNGIPKLRLLENNIRGHAWALSK